MLTKEEMSLPRAADRVVIFLAPFVLLVPVLLAFFRASLRQEHGAIDIVGASLLFLCRRVCPRYSRYSWRVGSSRNKYSLLGAMRGIAQMISVRYCRWSLSALTVVMMVGPCGSRKSSMHNRRHSGAGFMPASFHAWGFAGFLIVPGGRHGRIIRTPFDIPEATSEIIAGVLVRIWGSNTHIFFLGELPRSLCREHSRNHAVSCGGASAIRLPLALPLHGRGFLLKLVGMIYFLHLDPWDTAALTHRQLMAFRLENYLLANGLGSTSLRRGYGASRATGKCRRPRSLVGIICAVVIAPPPITLSGRTLLPIASRTRKILRVFAE
jgi:NADH-quinone oxidoreductase subunit H